GGGRLPVGTPPPIAADSCNSRVCALFGRAAPGVSGAVAAFDVVDHDLLEVLGDCRPPQSYRLLAVDEHRRGRRLTGAGQRDADIGMFAFARTVHDATHDGNIQSFDARIAFLPLRHRLADERLDAPGKFLERGRGGAATTRAGRHQRYEG